MRKMQIPVVYQLRVQRRMGFSLVEFLIAMTIGLFLLAGMATVFSTTNISYNSQTGLAQLQNNQLLAMNMLSNVLQSAGFYTSPQTQSFAAALPGSVTQANLPGNMQLYNSANHSHVTPLSTAPGSSMSFGIGQAVAGGSLYNGGPDVVAVRAQGSTTAPIGPLDCSGATTGNLTVSVFTVSNGNLLCLTYASQTAAYPSNWLVLVNNVSSMNVYYGLDPNSTGSATEYVSAANVTAWNQVMSVRVTLTFVNTVSTNAITFTRVIGIMGML